MRITIAVRIKGASPFEFAGKSMETKKIKWSELPKQGKGTLELILALEGKIIPKEQDCGTQGQGSDLERIYYQSS